MFPYQDVIHMIKVFLKIWSVKLYFCSETYLNSAYLSPRYSITLTFHIFIALFSLFVCLFIFSIGCSFCMCFCLNIGLKSYTYLLYFSNILGDYVKNLYT